MPAPKTPGQYFTPLPVARFAWEALRLFAPTLHLPRVIDPACGAGVFLQAALDLRVTAPERLYGCDSDPEVQTAWREEGLEGTGAHLFVRDGLTALDGEIAAGGFDVVIGNPPFHTTPLHGAPDEMLAEIAGRLSLWRRGRPAPLARRLNGILGQEARQLREFPSELLFLDRFHELCRPEGWIVIILPEGICANDRWRFVREWMLRSLTVHAIVGLPRRTFKAMATTAKTCLLVMRNSPPLPEDRILMAEVEHVGIDGGANELPGVLDAWREGREVGSVTPWLPVPGR
jgi:type I restriction-modification system DNA methylase subunit